MHRVRVGHLLASSTQNIPTLYVCTNSDVSVPINITVNHMHDSGPLFHGYVVYR